MSPRPVDVLGDGAAQGYVRSTSDLAPAQLDRYCSLDAAVQHVLEGLGGRLVDGWFAFGVYDILVIYELPDNISAAALAIAISAGGAMKAVKRPRRCSAAPLLSFDFERHPRPDFSEVCAIE